MTPLSALFGLWTPKNAVGTGTFFIGGGIKNVAQGGGRLLAGNIAKGTGGFGRLFQQRAEKLRKAMIEFNRVGRELEVPGGLAGAIRHTRLTGELVGNSDHFLKGQDAVRFFNRQIRQIGNSHDIPEAGRRSLIDVATRSRNKILNALYGNLQ